MAFFTLYAKDGSASVQVPHRSGVPGINENWPCELIIRPDDDRLEIRPRMSKKDSVYLPLNKVIQAGVVTEQEIIEKSKSVVGRAVLGGLILGPVGAIVGGTSGVGKKEKKVTHAYFIINYQPDPQVDDIKVLTFDITGALYLNQFTELLQDRAEIVESKPNLSHGPISL